MNKKAYFLDGRKDHAHRKMIQIFYIISCMEYCRDPSLREPFHRVLALDCTVNAKKSLHRDLTRLGMVASRRVGLEAISAMAEKGKEQSAQVLHILSIGHVLIFLMTNVLYHLT